MPTTPIFQIKFQFQYISITNELEKNNLKSSYYN